MSDKEIDLMLAENQRRLSLLHAHFDPITGQGSTGSRVKAHIDTGGADPWLWLPEPMMTDPLVVRAIERGGVKEAERDDFERLRMLHDFPYWAARYVYIKRKGGGDDCLLRLTYPQRKFVEMLERQRLAGQPIRVVLLKARQWGGSTVSQLYMAWLQLVHCTGLNSLIIAHQGTASDEIKDMFDRMMAAYPEHLLHSDDCEPTEDAKPAPKLVGVGKTRSIYRVPQRNCKIKIGTAERPDSCRGGDYNLVHLSEVGIWKQTKGKRPEDIVRSACAGVLYKPNTMIVYESTANGVGNFFHREYLDARDNAHSQFRSLFIAWHEIEQNEIPFASDDERRAFACQLWQGRLADEAPTSRQESGRYLWGLWQRGATLEGINWYMVERAKHMEHGSMAAECPSDDVEAFVNSGASVFNMHLVEAMRPDCRRPMAVGDVQGRSLAGADALSDVRFVSDPNGLLHIWRHPEPEDPEQGPIAGRYLAVVDIGGRSYKSDWSVVVVFDRKPMMSGGRPEVAAQWYGHIDMDLLAWKAAQVAAYYDQALLVVESNTLETHDPMRMVDGDQSQFILNQISRHYGNLYARRQSEEDIRQRVPRKYGFHTNIATKPMVISTLVRAVRDRLYIERDERCLAELLTYERKANGSYGAIVGAHDDLLMTRAIGLHICMCEMEPPHRMPQWPATNARTRLF